MMIYCFVVGICAGGLFGVVARSLSYWLKEKRTPHFHVVLRSRGEQQVVCIKNGNVTITKPSIHTDFCPNCGEFWTGENASFFTTTKEASNEHR